MNHGPLREHMVKAILVDFDGVLRKWPDSDNLIENSYGLIPGSIREAAFRNDLLDPAIRGLITDKQWRVNIVAVLQATQPDSDVESAINEWSASPGEVDEELLSLLSACKLSTEIMLFTNATSRLNNDLAVLGLDNWFSQVLNSSEMGSVKPEPGMYQAAIESCKCSANEIVYIDDSLQNITEANKEGITSHHYTSIEGCKQFLLDVGLLNE